MNVYALTDLKKTVYRIFKSLSLSLIQSLLLNTMNKMKNFKRRFSLSVPRTETIEENEFTEQINQLNIQHTQGKKPPLSAHCCYVFYDTLCFHNPTASSLLNTTWLTETY